MLNKPYHPDNFDLQPYPAWKVATLAWAGKALGVQFKIGGIPFGGAYRKDLWDKQDRVRAPA